jgi:hypothetical protein
MKDLELNTPLTIEEIDFRVQSINKGGYATIFAYKDARADMNRLDAIFGIFNWQKKYDLINGNIFCSVGVYSDLLKEWIWKQDVGVESNTEKTKGQASDAFKRACFNLGIGRELYEYPIIKIKLNENEYDKLTNKPTFNFKLKEWIWISEFENGKLKFLKARDNNGVQRFVYEKKHAKFDIEDEKLVKNINSFDNIDQFVDFRTKYALTSLQKSLVTKKFNELFPNYKK